MSRTHIGCIDEHFWFFEAVYQVEIDVLCQ